MEGEVRKYFQCSLEKKGLNFKLKTKVFSVDTSGDVAKLTLEPSAGGEHTTFEEDVVLVSAGHVPFTEGLGLDKLGVEMGKVGRILVNERFASNVPGVYAIGDDIPGPMLAHKEEEDGVACVEFIAAKHGHVDYDLVPGVVYTHSEVASVGKIKEQVKSLSFKHWCKDERYRPKVKDRDGYPCFILVSKGTAQAVKYSISFPVSRCN
ncbi:hypothetical protein RND81_10G125500 [Saponaria officinalis]|uniref:FAD/NAD(P)-binding domain-containing protein n=1 Tax=Saponaria officinalis TaxID=3572 RepID=A0AAW1I1C0_SAPOF